MFWIEKGITVFTIIFLNLTFLAVGHALHRLLKIRLSSTLEYLITSFGLGSGIVGIAIFIIGTTFGLSSTVIYTILFVLLSSSAYIAFNERQLIKNFISSFKPPKLQLAEKILLAVVISVFVYNLYRGLWPDVDFDSLWYHLTEPKLYLMWEKIKFIRGGLLYYSAMPQLVEMLYLVGMFVKGGIGAKLIHTFFGIWCFGLTYLWGKNLTKTTLGGLTSGLIFYVSNIVFWESKNAYIDLAVTFYISLGIYFFFKHVTKQIQHCHPELVERRQRFYLILSSTFIGFAIGAKLLSIYFVGIILLANLINSLFFQKKKLKVIVIESFIIGVIPALLWLPWGIYSYLNTHNPVYPLLEGLFNQNDWFSGTQLEGMGKIAWMKYQLGNLIRFPVDILHKDFGYSPVLIYGFFSSVLIFVRKKRFQIAGILFVLFLLLWNFTPARGGRFFLPITIMLTIFSSYFLNNISKKSNLHKWLIVLVVTTNSIVQFCIFNDSFKPNVWIYSAETEQEYLTTNVSQNMWTSYDYNGRVKYIVGDSKVLVYNVHNLFYVDFDFDEVSWTQLKHELYGDRLQIEKNVKADYDYLLIKRSSLEELAGELGIKGFSPGLYDLEYKDTFAEIKLFKINK